jgi:predicted esterase
VTDSVDVHSIATTIHGRVLVRRAAAPRGVLVGFHGYFENAEIQLERLDQIAGAGWTRVSVQALHRVYRGRTPEIAASWMTQQDREDMIVDNVAYVANAVRAVAGGETPPIVYAGFSQGVAMAFRAAVRSGGAGVIGVGGDVPPELLDDAAAVFPPVFLARGNDDEWYSQQKHDADVAALRARGVALDVLHYDAGHEWTEGVSAAAAAWLANLQL